MANTQQLAERVRLQAQAERQRRQQEGTWSGGLVPHTEYQDRPVDWIVDKLGVPRHMIQWSLNSGYEDHAWDGEPDPLVVALECLAQGQSIAVPSGTTTGKTFTIGACGTLWFLACFKDANVLSIAPKRELLLKNLWKEIGKLWPRFKAHFPTAELLTGTLRMREGEGEHEIWTASAFGAGVGVEEELAQNLKGFHAEHMLWFLEEGPGLEPPIIKTIIKTASGRHNPIAMFGNPEHRYDTLGEFGRRPWVREIRISALDFPNVVCDEEIIPGGRSRESVARDLEDAGGDENDSEYLSQVRGIAPEQATRALVRRSWCEAAAARWADTALREGPPALGVDVSDSPSGDLSTVSRWKGACCTEVDAFHPEDAGALGRQIYAEMHDPETPVSARHVGVDGVGVGASTVNELKRLGERVRVISGATRPIPRVDIEARPDEADDPKKPVVETERYDNNSSQVLWTLREDLRLGRIALPDDPLLFEELCVYQYEESLGKIAVKSSDWVRARIKRSPDRAKAVAYGNWVRARRRAVLPDEDEEEPHDPNRDRGLERLLAARDRARRREAFGRKFRRKRRRR